MWKYFAEKSRKRSYAYSLLIIYQYFNMEMYRFVNKLLHSF